MSGVEKAKMSFREGKGQLGVFLSVLSPADAFPCQLLSSAQPVLTVSTEMSGMTGSEAEADE